MEPDVSATGMSGAPARGGAELAALVLGRPVDEALSRFVDLLTTAGVERGLLGPREAERIWERHVLNCAVVEELLAPGTRMADLGSGAGLPGLVLALVRPDLRVSLIEPLLRRAKFLEEMVADLGLEGRVRIERIRGEEYRGSRFPVVTARAVAPLDRLVAAARPLLAAGGQLLAIKGRRAAEEVAAHRPAIERLGAVGVEVRTIGPAELLDEKTTVVVVRMGSSHTS